MSEGGQNNRIRGITCGGSSYELFLQEKIYNGRYYKCVIAHMYKENL
jgi:hypothetical protein